jgi:membrane-bound lytic murein transglycosylase B
MKSRPFHSLLLALALCAGSSSFVSTATAQAADPVAAAVLVLQEELLDATTASAVAAAKAKALAAGVPLATVQATIASVRPQPVGSVPSAVQAQAKVQKSVSTTAQTVGGSTRSSGGGIPAGGTSAGDTGSTYNN